MRVLSDIDFVAQTVVDLGDAFVGSKRREWRSLRVPVGDLPVLSSSE